MPSHVSVRSGSKAAPQEALRTTETEHRLDSATLLTTAPQLEHADFSKLIFAAEAAVFELHSHLTSHRSDSLTTNTQFSGFALTRSGFNKYDGTGTFQSDKQEASRWVLPPSNAAPTSIGRPRESVQQASVVLSSSAADAHITLKSHHTTKLSTATSSIPPSTTKQSETLTPGGMLGFGGASLSMLPDGSEIVVLADGSKIRFEDGEAAEIRLQNGFVFRLARSSTVYLVDTSTVAAELQATGSALEELTERTTTTARVHNEDISLSCGMTGASIGVSTNNTIEYSAVEIFTGAASACSRDTLGLVTGMLIAFEWLIVG